MIVLHTLGTAQIDIGRARLTPKATKKFALLFRLIAEPGRRLSRVQLEDTFFPNATRESARHALRQLFYELRRIGVDMELGAEWIAVPASLVVRDYQAFVDKESRDDAQLHAAAAGFLPGFTPHYSDAYADWLETFRASTVAELCRVLLADVEHAKERGNWARASLAARTCLVLDPLNGRAIAGLAEVLAIGGSVTEAERLLDTYAAEMGTGASPGHPRVIAPAAHRGTAARSVCGHAPPALWRSR